MDTCRWSRSAAAAIEHASPRWAGVWSLLYTTGTAATTLATHVSLLAGSELTWAGMSLRWARDEIELAHGELPFTSRTVDLGDLRADDDPAIAGAVLGDLAAAILERLRTMTEAGGAPETADLANRVASLVRSAKPAFAEPAS
ncbi:MAG TPA: hypothetical protein VGK17_10050 [Propionicimonas sp.]